MRSNSRYIWTHRLTGGTTWTCWPSRTSTSSPATAASASGARRQPAQGHPVAPGQRPGSRLDLRLFERGARTLKLTEEGRALFERTGALLTELDEATTAIAAGGGTPRGRLRISAPLLFSQTAMGKLAADFARKFPEVRLEVTTEDRTRRPGRGRL
jgi:hypothetical protein